MARPRGGDERAGRWDGEDVGELLLGCGDERQLLAGTKWTGLPAASFGVHVEDGVEGVRDAGKEGGRAVGLGLE